MRYTQRDTIATSISTALDGATFKGQVLDDTAAQGLIVQARSLLAQVSACAADAIGCATAGSSLLAAVMPSARSVQVGTPATAYVMVINTGESTATAVGITLATSIPATLTHQTIDSSNTPVDIPAGGSRGFVIALTPTATSVLAARSI